MSCGVGAAPPVVIAFSEKAGPGHPDSLGVGDGPQQRQQTPPLQSVWDVATRWRQATSA